MTDIHIHLDGKTTSEKKASKKKAKKKPFLSGPAGFGEGACNKMFGW